MMQLDPHNRFRQETKLDRGAGVGLLRVVACLGALGIVTASPVHAQSAPSHRGTALEQLRSLVGIPPKDSSVDASPLASPRHPEGLAPIRLLSAPTKSAVPQAPGLAVARTQVPTPLDRAGHIVESLASLTLAASSDTSRVLPVTHSLPVFEPMISTSKATLSGVSAAVPRTLPVPESMPPSAFETEQRSANTNPAASTVDGPYRFNVWETLGSLVCLLLIGTFALTLLLLIARWSGLRCRFVFSLGSPTPRT